MKTIKTRTKNAWLFACASMMISVCFMSCQPKEKDEGDKDDGSDALTTVQSQRQHFILNVSISKTSQKSVVGDFESSVLPVLGEMKDLKSFRLMSVPTSNKSATYMVLLEIDNADAKGIVVNGKGKVVKVDVSKFIEGSPKAKDALDRLLSHKGDLLEMEMWLCNDEAQLSIDRNISAYSSAAK